MIFNESGGTSLNFKVVGNPQPSNPSENTIWVNTDRKITGWYFFPTEPKNMAEGEVWFISGTSSVVEFNALKKNGILISPISAKQNVGGTLVDKTAKIYQGGEWKSWIIYLYNYGDACNNVTGGWKTGMNYNSGVTVKGLTFNTNDMQIKGQTGEYFGGCGTTNKINLSGYSKLNALAKVLSASGDAFMCVSSQLTSFNDYKMGSKALPTTESVISIDISNMTSGYIVFCSGTTTATIKSVWLE